MIKSYSKLMILHILNILSIGFDQEVFNSAQNAIFDRRFVWINNIVLMNSKTIKMPMEFIFAFEIA